MMMIIIYYTGTPRELWKVCSYAPPTFTPEELRALPSSVVPFVPGYQRNPETRKKWTFEDLDVRRNYSTFIHVCIILSSVIVNTEQYSIKEILDFSTPIIMTVYLS